MQRLLRAICKDAQILKNYRRTKVWLEVTRLTRRVRQMRKRGSGFTAVCENAKVRGASHFWTSQSTHSTNQIVVTMKKKNVSLGATKCTEGGATMVTIMETIRMVARKIIKKSRPLFANSAIENRRFSFGEMMSKSKIYQRYPSLRYWEGWSRIWLRRPTTWSTFGWGTTLSSLVIAESRSTLTAWQHRLFTIRKSTAKSARVTTSCS